MPGDRLDIFWFSGWTQLKCFCRTNLQGTENCIDFCSIDFTAEWSSVELFWTAVSYNPATAVESQSYYIDCTHADSYRHSLLSELMFQLQRFWQITPAKCLHVFSFCLKTELLLELSPNHPIQCIWSSFAMVHSFYSFKQSEKYYCLTILITRFTTIR